MPLLRLSTLWIRLSICGYIWGSVACSPVTAELLLGWGNMDRNDSSPQSAFNAAGIEPSELTIAPESGSALTLLANNFQSWRVDWPNHPSDTFADAITKNSFFSLTVAPASGYESFSVSRITMVIDWESGNSPSRLALLSSVDGFQSTSTVLGTINQGADGVYSFDAIGLASLTGPTEFRVYGYDSLWGNNGGGYLGFGHNSSNVIGEPDTTGLQVGVFGGVIVPEAGSLVLGFVGCVAVAVAGRLSRRV